MCFKRDTYIQCTFDDAAANEISELLNSFSKDNLLSYNQIKKNQSYYVDSRSDISSINHPVEFLADDAWLWNK